MKRVALLVALSFATLPCPVVAEEQSKDLLPPAWTVMGDLSGKYVNVTGSDTKFLEDYNIQDGVDGHVTVTRELSDDRSLRIDALGQSGEEQGYLIGNYQRLGHYSLLLDVSASQRYYNARTGDAPQTSAGVPLEGNFYPFTNDSRVLFGNDDPSIHRIDTGATLDYQPHAAFHDVYLDFHYEGVTGQETLLKGSTIDDPTAVADGSGPGTVAFDFPGRKQVDYQTVGGFVGGRTGLGGLNWQTDGTYQHSDIKADTIEADFGTNLATTQLQRYREDSSVDVGKYDLVASRHLRPDLYVYGGYLFSYEHNNPMPAQFVTPDAAMGTTLTTRSTSDGHVHRMINSLGLGLLYHPLRTLVVTANTRAWGSVQSGDISENRNEAQFLLGNVGSVDNQSDRHWVDSTSQVAADWAAIPRTLVHGYLRYRYRGAQTDSTRSFNFVQVRDPEVQDYGNTYNTGEAGASARWSGTGGKSVEVGYSYFYEDMHTSVDQIRNEYIQGDYLRRRHNPYLRGSARLAKNLHGQLRFDYVYERRNLSAPFVDPLQFTMPGGGKTDWESFRVTPILTYLIDPHWSVFGAFSAGQDRLTIADIGTVPANFGTFQPFEYDALTETVATAVSYAPSEVWSLATSYNYVHNGHSSVGNQIHRVEISGRYRINKRWDAQAGYRYLRFDQDNFSVDDYRANIPYVGVVGHF